MRTLNRNKQTLYLSNQSNKVPVYERDAYGNIKTMIIDGKLVRIETGDYELGYSNPIKIKGNISSTGGSESTTVDFGIDISGYDAVLVGVENLGNAKISETSLIWFESEVKYKDLGHTIIDPDSADYRVTKLSPSLNEDRYLLNRIVKE